MSIPFNLAEILQASNEINDMNMLCNVQNHTHCIRLLPLVLLYSLLLLLKVQSSCLFNLKADLLLPTAKISVSGITNTHFYKGENAVKREGVVDSGALQQI